jgi:hypothetical protein
MDRIYKIIELPNENVIHALNVCIGEYSNVRYSLDGSKVIIKTTQELIDIEINKGVTLEQIFPSEKTQDFTLEQLKIELQKENWSGSDEWKNIQ